MGAIPLLVTETFNCVFVAVKINGASNLELMKSAASPSPHVPQSSLTQRTSIKTHFNVTIVSNLFGCTIVSGKEKSLFFQHTLIHISESSNPASLKTTGTLAGLSIMFAR